jgi:hypothetical protein
MSPSGEICASKKKSATPPLGSDLDHAIDGDGGGAASLLPNPPVPWTLLRLARP